MLYLPSKITLSRFSKNKLQLIVENYIFIFIYIASKLVQNSATLPI